jgi:6,7-dimethyl-8-ribityllumazine synthase
MPKTRPAKKFPKVNRLKGGFSALGRRFGIVVSEFNEPLTNALLDGALDTLTRHGAREKDIHVVYVPGAFEIPLAAKKLIARRKPDAVITLAVVIKGETRHFDQVVTESAKGVRELSDKSGVPVILGIIASDDVAHALERTGIKHANKGREWALAAIEMAGVSRALR